MPEAVLAKTAAATPTATEIEARLRSLASATTPAARAVRREFSKRLAPSPACEVVRIATVLFERPGLACRFVAYELVLYHRGALESLGPRDVERFGRGLASWGDVDCFACYVAGPSWRAGRISDALVVSWTRSRDRFRRRAALVATVPLNDRTTGTGDAARTLAVCRRLVSDRDDLVVKALSWALRALAKRDPASVREFLAAHDADLPPRVRREVRAKLETGRKRARRAAKRGA